jgi:hypothetical protein
MIGEVATALLEGRMPDAGARLFLAGGLLAWLTQDGDLLRDYWMVTGRQGSTHTPAVLWKKIQQAKRATSSGRATSRARIDKIDLNPTPGEKK